MYAKITDNAVSQYPYTLGQLRADNPDTSLPRNLSQEQWLAFGATVVAETTKPSGDVVTEITPINVGGVWTQQWSSRSYTSDETQEQLANLQASIVAGTQKHLDTTAQDHGYDSILSACTYANSSVTRYQTEGTYCVGLRDATWSALETILAEVQAGTRAVPAGFDDIADDLPAVVWP